MIDYGYLGIIDCPLMGLDLAKTVGIFAKAIGILWQVQLQVNILTYQKYHSKEEWPHEQRGGDFYSFAIGIIIYILI